MSSILHFSDVHFPLRADTVSWRDFRRPKRILAGLNFLVRRRAVFREVPVKWRAFLEYVRGDRFDAIVCTGDLTTMGTLGELKAARGEIDELVRHAAFVLLPGNHDLYLPGVESDAFADIFRDCFEGEGLLRNRGQNSVFPFLRLVGADAAILAVNTAKPNPVMWRSSGYAAPQQLAAARALLARGELAGRQVIVATHYNADDRDTWRHGLENRREFRELLLGASCDLLVHGHVHRSGETAADASGPRSVCAGSLTYKGREAFRVYETGAGGIALRRGVWDGQRYLLSS